MEGASRGGGPAPIFRSLPAPDANPDARASARGLATPRDALQLPGPRALDRTGERRTHTHHTDARTLTSGRCCHGDQDSRAGSGRTKTRETTRPSCVLNRSFFLFIYRRKLPSLIGSKMHGGRRSHAWREEEPPTGA